jgi:hypothetical protein
MADPIDPNIENMGNQVGRTATLVDGLLKSLRPVYDLLSKSFGAEAVSNASKYTAQIGSLSDKFTNLKEQFSQLSDGDLQFVVTFNGNKPTEEVDNWIKSFQGFSQFISNARIFDKFSVDSAASLNTVSDSIDKIQQGLRVLGFNKSIDTALIQNATQAEKLENNFIALAASTGKMNDLFDKGGTELKDLGAITSAYTGRIADVADATGFSVSQTLEFAAALGKIPEAMDKTIQVGDGVSDQLNSLQVAMRLMSGSGRSQKDVFDTLNVAYEKLSTSQGVITDNAQRGAEMFAVMSQASNVLNLRFEDVKNVIESIADQFKFVGNETDAATRLLARYTDALRETGLTSRASIDIIQQMVKSISDVNMGTKAFISLRTGGPGGLQGGFRIEQMLREGRLDQVVTMMERAFRQQAGGRMFTLAQAAQSPEAAAGFMRQRQLLQSGAFGIGRGMGDDQATRFLEALGKGGLGGGTEAAKMLANSLKPGQDALQTVNERGANIQERSWNELKKANNFLERNAVAAELFAGMNVRQFFGATGNRGADLRRGMSAATGRAREDVLGVGALQGIGPSDRQEQIRQLITIGRQAVAEGVSASREILQGVGEGVGAIGEGIKGMIDDATDDIDTTEYATPPGQRPTSQLQQQRERTMAVATQMAQDKQQALGPQKITLEIQAPAGFDTKVKEKPDNVDINFVQQLSRSNMMPT